MNLNKVAVTCYDTVGFKLHVKVRKEMSKERRFDLGITPNDIKLHGSNPAKQKAGLIIWSNLGMPRMLK